MRMEIGRIGDMGIRALSSEDFEKKRRFLPYVHANRIPLDEAAQVYDGFEIASHGATHMMMDKADEEATRQEIIEDIQNLKKIFQQDITGFAYPNGAENNEKQPCTTPVGVWGGYELRGGDGQHCASFGRKSKQRND